MSGSAVVVSLPATVSLGREFVLDICATLDGVGDSTQSRTLADALYGASDRLRVAAFGVLDNDDHPLWDEMATRAHKVADSLAQ